MSEHTYRYIQQATITPVKEWENVGILRALDLEYMGSAEFEFGALPKALVRLLTDTEPMVFGSIEVSVPKKRGWDVRELVTVNVRYLCRKSQECTLRAMLSNWMHAKRNFKEWNVGVAKEKDFCFCIDQGWECFFWNGKLGKRLLKECVVRSTELLIDNPSYTTPALTALRGKSADELLRVV